jgi:hypothetical protein
MPITFHCLPVADRMVRSIGIRVAGSRSSDPSPPIRIPAYIAPRSPVQMPSLHALHGCGYRESPTSVGGRGDPLVHSGTVPPEPPPPSPVSPTPRVRNTYPCQARLSHYNRTRKEVRTDEHPEKVWRGGLPASGNSGRVLRLPWEEQTQR